MAPASGGRHVPAVQCVHLARQLLLLLSMCRESTRASAAANLMNAVALFLQRALSLHSRMAGKGGVQVAYCRLFSFRHGRRALIAMCASKDMSGRKRNMMHASLHIVQQAASCRRASTWHLLELRCSLKCQLCGKLGPAHQLHDGAAAAAQYCHSGPSLPDSGAAHLNCYAAYVHLLLCTLRIHQITASNTDIWVQLMLCARCSSSSRVLPGVWRSGHCIHAGVTGAKFVHLACAASTGLGLISMSLDVGTLVAANSASTQLSWNGAEVILELRWCCWSFQVL